MGKILCILLEAIGTILMCLVIIASAQWFADAIIPIITGIHM